MSFGRQFVKPIQCRQKNIGISNADRSKSIY
jgi:hypothetical protein